LGVDKFWGRSKVRNAVRERGLRKGRNFSEQEGFWSLKPAGSSGERKRQTSRIRGSQSKTLVV
jgi:hypothetical protein